MANAITIKNIQPFLKFTHTKHSSKLLTTSYLVGKGKLLNIASCFDELVNWSVFDGGTKSVQHISICLCDKVW